MTVMLRLWCAGKLGNCPKTVKRFRFTCLACRWRRRFYGKFSDPPYWINYTYVSSVRKQLVNCFVQDGLTFKARTGGQLETTTWTTLIIDPRGHFTSLRCAIIMVLDWFMKALHIEKPLAEFCEFFANYPTI